MKFRDMTIRKKLTVLLLGAGAAAVMIACIIFYIMTTAHLRRSYEEGVAGLAQVMARNCEAALAFRIPEDAERVLGSLSANRSVTYAVVRDQQGNIFASYGRHPLSRHEGTPGPNILPDKDVPGFLKISQNITVGGSVVGSLTLFDDMKALRKDRLYALSIMFFVVLISAGLAFLLIAYMQRLIALPILSLASSARQISQQQDYSLRAEKQGNDEVGELVDSFNAMIGKIEKRNAELFESEKRFHTLVDQAVDAFFLFDPEGIIIDVNQQACASLGYTREEFLSGMTVRDIEAGPESGMPHEKPWGDLQPYAPITAERLHRRKDGEHFPVEIRMGLLHIGGHSFIMGLARDISERREAELERQKLEIQLQQSQKMEAVGHLAGGIAHDFNNMLQVIIGCGNLLDVQLDPDSPLRPLVTQLLNSAEKSAELTRQLLAFSRKQVICPKQADLNQLIRGIEKLLIRLIGEDIEFKTILADTELMVTVDSGQIGQVLMNLCTNARDAMPRGGHLSITTELALLGKDYIAANIIEKPGVYAVVSVTDSGVGMDEATRQKIFDPFFTTKETGKGTGLGLSIAYGIIKQHNGHISVYSEPGRGTTFRIYLPVIEAKAEGTRTAAETVSKGGTETILVAEDNDDVRELMKIVLEGAGYTVIEAADGDSAISRFHEHEGSIQLVILDVIMPKRSGREVYDRIKATNPAANILFSSGYTADVINTKGVLDEKMDFISKPVTPHNLLSKIREILDRVQETS
ncbi:MAG: PAS domain S-box protein [Nitrospirae bacterium]|nr:MAG: PAS domain S-box protein [Nitrospirota bacterium]